MRKQLHIIFRLVMFSCILLFVSQEASEQINFLCEESDDTPDDTSD